MGDLRWLESKCRAECRNDNVVASRIGRIKEKTTHTAVMAMHWVFSSKKYCVHARGREMVVLICGTCSPETTGRSCSLAVGNGVPSRSAEHSYLDDMQPVIAHVSFTEYTLGQSLGWFVAVEVELREC